jgi:predicted regulator of Ras-like GTPase activity (Roadblock/LC7/MglB family)
VYEILNKLNKIEGVHGSLIMGKDGLVVAADLGTDVDENAVAAVGSQIMSSLEGALRRMEMGAFRKFVVTGRDGKIIIADAGSVMIVALIDLNANMGLAGVEMKEAVKDIQSKLHMSQ